MIHIEGFRQFNCPVRLPSVAWVLVSSLFLPTLPLRTSVEDVLLEFRLVY
jgi:hypothetical protein